jgi:hypothetical protein
MTTKPTHLNSNGHVPVLTMSNGKSPLDRPSSETSEDSPQSRTPPPLCPSHRTGKVARLPAEARAEVNTMLRNAYGHKAIVAKLAELGHPGISVNSIYTWKYGGFVDWLHEQQRLEKSLALPKALEHCTRAARIAEVQQSALVIASTALTEIMSRFDFKHAVDLLYRRPQLFPSFVHSIAALGRCTSDLATAFARMQDAEKSLRDKAALISGNPAESLPSPLPAEPSANDQISTVSPKPDSLSKTE